MLLSSYHILLRWIFDNFLDENQVSLAKHLLKTIATDLVNVIFELVANQNLMSLAENESFTTEVCS